MTDRTIDEADEIVDAGLLSDYATPFQTLKTAEQKVQFAIDPSRGLSRSRYGWYSNGTLFDSTLVSGVPGEIQIQTRSTESTDSARLRSAFAGQYVSQALAQPGIEVSVDASNVNFDSNGFASLSHGQVYAGTFWWDAANAVVETGIGFEYDDSELAVFWRSGGSHLGASPVAQPNWNQDTMSGQDDDANPSGIQFDPSAGWVTNDVYWWYNRGRLLIALVDPESNELIPVHQFIPYEDEPGKPNLVTPNLPTQVVVENAGTAATLTAAVGGTQYTLHGADGVKETRDSYGADESRSVTTAVNSPIDPTGEPGDPLYAVKRESGERDLELRLEDFIVKPDQDIIVYFWDEWDYGTATGTNSSFEETFRLNTNETKTQFDRSATSYTPTTAVFRGMRRAEGAAGSQSIATTADIENRIPIGATRVVTAVDRGNNASASFTGQQREGY